MPGYPQNKSLVWQIRDLQRRVKSLEQRVALTGTAGGSGAATPVWDVNSIYNGNMESGTTGWGRGYWQNGTPVGVMTAEQANPLDGTQSLRMDEAAGGATQAWWRPSGAGASSSGVDVFPTAPGDTWRVTALVAASTALTIHLRFMLGTGLLDPYAILTPNVSYVEVVNRALVAGAPAVSITGQIIVPAGAWNYIGFHAQPDALAAAGTWWLDDVDMDRRLQ